MNRKSTYLVLVLLYAPMSLAFDTRFDYLFQADPGSETLLQNNFFERDIYSGIGARTTLLDRFGIGNKYIVPVGSTWTWKLYLIEDRSGSATNQLLGEHSISYLGQVGNCLTLWSNGNCSQIRAWRVWWNFPCLDEGRYRIEILFNGNGLGAGEFSPTRFMPSIDRVTIFGTNISPELTGDNFASKTMPTIPAKDSFSLSLVKGIAGNLKQCQKTISDAIVRVTNTITPGSGGHAHFTDVNEIGSGVYTPENPGDILDPVIAMTMNTVIEGHTSAQGSFVAHYTAGDQGVSETITVEARREATATYPKLKSEPHIKQLDIKAPGLVEIPQGAGDGQFYFRYKGTCIHSPTARWVVRGMRSRLVVLDAIYKFKFGHRLSFNDAGLEFGGRFDNGKNLGRDSLCHKSHRRGNDIDLNSVDEGSQNIRTTMVNPDNTRSVPIITYVERLANRLGLEKLRINSSIHFRYINY